MMMIIVIIIIIIIIIMIILITIIIITIIIIKQFARKDLWGDAKSLVDSETTTRKVLRVKIF